jgi:membrane protein YqaA with SNARE-associated domain
MILFLFSVKSFLGKVFKYLAIFSKYVATFGALGLFTLSLLDSAFLPLPSGADLLLIALSAHSPNRMLLYVLFATLGSTIGCVILYSVSRKAGHRALSKFSQAKQARVKDLIDRYDVFSVLVACVLPPPFPLKLFVVTAGVVRISLTRFACAIFAGRAFRYLLEGYIAARYGDQASAIMAKYYPWIGLGLAVLLTAFVVGRALLKRGPETVETVEAGN